MSRLYVWLNSDMNQEVTRRANKNLRIQVNYGSRDDSKHLVTLEVDYPKDDSKPSIIIKEKGNRHSASQNPSLPS